MSVARLSRALPDMPPAAPVRILHIGLGNFHRAHQAWYTAHAPDADQWGIAGFTGRRPDLADALAPQDGLYTLITRGAEGDSFELIGTLSDVHPATDHETYLAYFSDPQTALITITVTEAAYLRNAEGRLDTEQDVIITDLEALRSDPRGMASSLPARLVAGLLARRDAGSSAITILSCDNLPENGEVTKTVVTEFARLVDESLLDWIGANVDFAPRWLTGSPRGPQTRTAGSSKSRTATSTPLRCPPSLLAIGWCRRFPAGQPRWEDAGALLVDDVAPFEQRKLWGC